MRFAMLDADGLVLSAHNDETIAELPDGGAPLDEDQWERRFYLRWDGEKWNEIPAPQATEQQEDE
ncbi:MAG: hypothetical protein CMI10_13485 [Oceanospirillaceae bacterium]|nr:hypothetical protein [Oceanospirillaceae bacterium]|tara:strand:+ start:284 stop:478 length:195 start_codon:yes stop_codon:yes gene_type:complete